jgi:hypothetical protein
MNEFADLRRFQIRKSKKKDWVRKLQIRKE